MRSRANHSTQRGEETLRGALFELTLKHAEVLEVKRDMDTLRAAAQYAFDTIDTRYFGTAMVKLGHALEDTKHEEEE